jgi:hypothetical protein
LSLGKNLNGSKPPALGVSFKIISIDIKILKQLLRNAIIAAFGEMPTGDEVVAADVHADMHVCGAFGDAGIVEGDVGV